MRGDALAPQPLPRRALVVHLTRVERDEAGAVLGEERMFEGAFGRIRDVRVAPDGAVWLATDDSHGKLIRISRAD